MKQCAQEPVILAAASGGSPLDAKSASHLAVCAGCRLAFRAAEAMEKVVQAPVPQHALVSARVVWLKRQLLREHEIPRAIASAAAPLNGTIFVLVAAISVVVLAVRRSSLHEIAAGLSEQALFGGLTALSIQPLMLAGVTFFLIVAATGILTMRLVLRDE